MFVAVGLQIAAMVLLAPIAGFAFGLESAASLVLGSAAAIIPNGLFALRLWLQKGRSPESYPVVFLVGEFVKIGLTIGLLAAVVRWVEPIRWLALLTGLIVALKMPLFALLVARDAEAGTAAGNEPAAPPARQDKSSGGNADGA